MKPRPGSEPRPLSGRESAGGASDPALGTIPAHSSLPHGAGRPAKGRGETILGIDPGLATTGWGVIEKGTHGLGLKSYGVIETPAQDSLPSRLLQIRTELLKLIDVYQPTVVAIEELFFAKFATSIAATAQARGAILSALAERRLPMSEYNPRTVKVAMTGFGSASKEQMQAMVQRYFRLQELPRPDDAADAIAIALCHAQTHPQQRLSDQAIRRSSKALENLIAQSLNRSIAPS